MQTANQHRVARGGVTASVLALFLAGPGCQGAGLPSPPGLPGVGNGCEVCPPAVPTTPVAPPTYSQPMVTAQQPLQPSMEHMAQPSMGAPPSARPGEVYCYVQVPPVVQTVTETVCIKPASTRQVFVPPVTQQVTEQVMVKPEERRRIAIPPQFADQAREVMVSPARMEWKRVGCTTGEVQPAESLGECWTLAQLPPQFETRTERVCVQPEAFHDEVIPAQYETRTKTVTVRPAAYQTVQDPPQFETRTRNVLVSQARWEWRRNSVCEVPEITGQPTPEPQIVPETPTPSANIWGVPQPTQPAWPQGVAPGDAWNAQPGTVWPHDPNAVWPSQPQQPGATLPAAQPIQQGTPTFVGPNRPAATQTLPPPSPWGEGTAPDSTPAPAKDEQPDLPPSGALPPVPEFDN